MRDSVIDINQLKRELSSLVSRYNAEAAYLFGSYARGQATSDSDLDVLIVGGDDFYAADIFAIAEDLYKAFGKPVDVYELRELERDSAFYQSVMEDRVLVA